MVDWPLKSPCCWERGITLCGLQHKPVSSCTLVPPLAADWMGVYLAEEGGVWVGCWQPMSVQLEVKASCFSLPLTALHSHAGPKCVECETRGGETLEAAAFHLWRLTVSHTLTLACTSAPKRHLCDSAWYLRLALGNGLSCKREHCHAAVGWTPDNPFNPGESGFPPGERVMDRCVTVTWVWGRQRKINPGMALLCSSWHGLSSNFPYTGSIQRSLKINSKLL